MEWIKKFMEWVGIDGLHHFSLSALLIFALGWIRPIWIAVVIAVLGCCIAEVYVSRNDAPWWKGIVCDLAGLGIGLMLVWFNILAR